MADAGSNLIVALDYDSPDAALDLAKRLDPATVRLKVGKQLFTLAGPDIVRSLQGLGFDIFLDLKFHWKKNNSFGPTVHILIQNLGPPP